eukprot:3500638-Ditylum_brightwellii.AAC.1
MRKEPTENSRCCWLGWKEKPMIGLAKNGNFNRSNKSPQLSTSMMNSPSLVSSVPSSSSRVTPSPTLNKYKFKLAFMPTSLMSAPSTPKLYTSDDKLEEEIAAET